MKFLRVLIIFGFKILHACGINTVVLIRVVLTNINTDRNNIFVIHINLVSTGNKQINVQFEKVNRFSV